MFSICIPAGCLGDPPARRSSARPLSVFLPFLGPDNQTDTRKNGHPGHYQPNRYPLIQEEHAAHGRKQWNTDLHRGRNTGFEAGQHGIPDDVAQRGSKGS